LLACGFQFFDRYFYDSELSSRFFWGIENQQDEVIKLQWLENMYFFVSHLESDMPYSLDVAVHFETKKYVNYLMSLL
jgi:hypothetical protein